jgi:hypothetical protein
MHNDEHNDLRPYVWGIIITAIITMAGLYALNRCQLHQPTPAQEGKLFQAARERGAIDVLQQMPR